MDTPLCDAVARRYEIIFDTPEAVKVRELEEAARNLVRATGWPTEQAMKRLTEACGMVTSRNAEDLKAEVDALREEHRRWDADMIALAQQRDDLIAALKRIADGPWPDDCEGPEGQCVFDEGVARSALKKVGADDTADKRPNA